MGDGIKGIQELYFKIAADKSGPYADWLLPVYRDSDSR
jgi:hypothetical protein